MNPRPANFAGPGHRRHGGGLIRVASWLRGAPASPPGPGVDAQIQGGCLPVLGLFLVKLNATAAHCFGSVCVLFLPFSGGGGGALEEQFATAGKFGGAAERND